MKNHKTRQEPIAGVFIATYNRAKVIPKTLRYIQEALGKYKVDVVVIDNASADNTSEVVKQFPFVHYLRNEKNYFVSRALTEAFQQFYAKKKYKYVILLADDVKVGPKMFDKLVEFMKAHPKVGLTAPAYIESETNTLRTLGLWIHPITSLLSNNLKDVGELKINHFVSCYVLKAELFSKLKGYDFLLFPMIYEEPDLGERVKKAGYQLYPCSAAKMWHPIQLKGKASSESKLVKKRLYNNKPKTYFFFRNRIMYMSLYSNVWQFLLFYLVFNPLIFLYYLPSIEPNFLIDALRGMFDGTVFALTKNRKYIQQQNKKLFQI